MPKPDRHYVACWTEETGMWSCSCEHPTVADAMRCLVPDGSAFLRVVEGTVFRSLNDSEFIEFLRAALQQPWHYLNKKAWLETEAQR